MLAAMMPMMSFQELAKLDLTDQWSRPVAWAAFEKVPTVLVLGGEKAANAAKDWGIFLQKEFNPSYKVVPTHLTARAPEENVKVIAVATLPEVPSMFKGLFRGGFRREVPEMGMVMDFSRALSSRFEYSDKSPEPKLVVRGPVVEGQAAKSFELSGFVNDEATKTKFKTEISNLLKSLKP
jgi:hypothetical protein